MATSNRDKTPSDLMLDHPADTDPTVAVIEAVSALSDRPIEDLPPLTSAVDPDALDALCVAAAAESSLTVSFQYAGHDVTISADGSITVHPTAA